MNNPTRCKFHCQKITKMVHWNGQGKFVYSAEFFVVHGDSPENKAFFEATPSGTLSLAVYKEDLFTPGKEYYLDISEA